MPVIVMQDKSRSQDEASSLTRILDRVFHKVIRLVIGTISLPALIELLKTIYVQEAQKKLVREGARPTKSALALMTGLDTRVVSTVLKQMESDSSFAQSVNPENALLDTWTNDPLFTDDDGEPAVLPIEGRGRTFQSLVLKTVGRNITVKTVLDRLIASGNVKVVEGEIEQVEMLSLFYSPISSDRIKMTEFAFLESSRVLSAAIHNMTSEPQMRVPQQGRWTYRLDPTKYKEFRVRARDLLEKQIKEGESLLEEFEEAAESPGQYTVGIGWYQWGDQVPEEEGG